MDAEGSSAVSGVSDLDAADAADLEAWPLICDKCLSRSKQWQAKCADCGRLGTIVPRASMRRALDEEPASAHGQHAVRLDEMAVVDFDRVPVKLGDVDRVLGGGAVKGHVALLAGRSGSGKSTLALQLLGTCERVALLIQSELGADATARYAERLNVRSSRLRFQQTRRVEDLDGIIASEGHADLVAIDSANEFSSAKIKGAPGQPAQLQATLAELVRIAQARKRAIVVIMHVIKTGRMAGPESLVHRAQITLKLMKKGDRRVLTVGKSQQGPDDQRAWFHRRGDGLLVPCDPPGDAATHGRRKRKHVRKRFDALARARPVDDSADDAAARAPAAPATPRARGRDGARDRPAR